MEEKRLEEGDPCPACGKPVERVEAQFYWRGDVKPGAVCRHCNALWVLKGHEIEPFKRVPEPPPSSV